MPLALLAAFGSLGLLLGAFGFQYLGGIHPCPMCLWQRWPHALAAALGLLVWLTARPGLLAPLGALAMAVSTGLGLYHSGVERGWWQGPTTCTSGPIGGLTPDQLMEQIMSAPLVRCDEIAWQMAGLTMPNLNALISALLCCLWVAALYRARRT